SSRRLGEVTAAMRRHAGLLVEHYRVHGADVVAERRGRHGRRLDAETCALRDFRKHTSWYLSGYPVGPEVRRRLSMVSSLAELDDVIGALDPALELVAGGERIKRGHTNGPIKVSLPEHYL